MENLKIGGSDESQVKLFEAIGKAMFSLEGVPKNANGRKGNQTFKYAPYHVLRTALLKVLGPNGVSWTQPFHTENGKHTLTLIVTGCGGCVISSLHFECDNDPQEIGRVCTYMRRYQLQSFFGLEGDRDFDDDETSSEKKTAKSESNSSNGAVRHNVGEKDTEKTDKNETEKKSDSSVAEVKSSTEQISKTNPKLDVKSANEKIYDSMKQLNWDMGKFSEFCKENEQELGGFNGPAKLTADQKNIVLRLLVEKQGVAPFWDVAK